MTSPRPAFSAACRRIAILGLGLLLAACGEVPQYTVGGTLSGLAPGASVTLLNRGEDPLVLSANGSFRFARTVREGDSYAITVGTQPQGQACAVAQGSGKSVVADVTGVKVTCADRSFSIAGTVRGLAAGSQLVLLNNGADPVVVTTDSFQFPVRVPFNGSYAVTVGVQPVGLQCAVAGQSGSGTGVVADVSNVQVVCDKLSFAIGGTLRGLAAGQQLEIQNNASETLVLRGNDPFQFTNRLPFGASYAVTISSQPVGAVCSVAAGTGSGSALAADVTNVAITCSTLTYTVGGSVTGLAAGQQVTLLNNGGDAQTVRADGPPTFRFPPQPWGASYAVTVSTQPVGQTCTVSQGQGQSLAQDVTGVAVDCRTSTYTVGGTLAGLAQGESLTLRNEATGEQLVLDSTISSFTFGIGVGVGKGYTVVVAKQPRTQVCTVTAKWTGSSIQADVTDVQVACAKGLAFSGGNLNWLWFPGAAATWAEAGALCVSFAGDLPNQAAITALFYDIRNSGNLPDNFPLGLLFWGKEDYDLRKDIAKTALWYTGGRFSKYTFEGYDYLKTERLGVVCVIR